MYEILFKSFKMILIDVGKVSQLITNSMMLKIDILFSLPISVFLPTKLM